MKNLINWMGIFGFVFLAAACSSGSPTGADAKGPGAKGNHQAQAGGACSEEFRGDYNTIVNAAKQLPANDPQALLQGLNDLKAQVTGFQQKYDGVVCSAVVEGKTVEIDVNAKCTAMQAALDKAIAQLQGHHGGGLVDEISDTLGSTLMSF